MVAPAGLRLVSGALAKANVSACALGAVTNPKSKAVIVIITAAGLRFFFIALFILALRFIWKSLLG
jgi:hypothetical protein